MDRARVEDMIAENRMDRARVEEITAENGQSKS